MTIKPAWLNNENGHVLDTVGNSITPEYLLTASRSSANYLFKSSIQLVVRPHAQRVHEKHSAFRGARAVRKDWIIPLERTRKREGHRGWGSGPFPAVGAREIIVQGNEFFCASSLPSSRALRLSLSFSPLKVSSPAYRVPMVSALKESLESSFICFVATSHNLRR